MTTAMSSERAAVIGCLGVILAAIIAGVFQIFSKQEIELLKNALDEAQARASEAVESQRRALEENIHLKLNAEAAVTKLNEVQQELEVVKDEVYRLKVKVLEKDLEVKDLNLSRKYILKNKEYFYRIELHNPCREKIYWSIYYEGLDGEWRTRGWWSTVGAQSYQPGVLTRNRYIWVYAEAEGRSRYWNGEGKPDVKSIKVSSKWFFNTESESVPGIHERSELFFRVDLGGVWGTETVLIRC